MRMEINKVYHNFIVRTVVFSIFLYKRQVRQPNVFRNSVNAFIKKRVPWDINLNINLDDIADLKIDRDIVIDDILGNNRDKTHRSIVKIEFKTPDMLTSMEIDLHDESKYEKIIYG